MEKSLFGEMFSEDSQSQSDLILILEGSLNFTHWSALQADDLAWIKKGHLMCCIIILNHICSQISTNYGLK